MELWIRSQDKECLMKIDRVDYCLANSEHRIMVNGYETLVSKYKTKERALEVLDEIQDKLKVLVTNEAGAEFILARNLVPIIYEMPKD